MEIFDCVCLVVKTRKQVSFKRIERGLLFRMHKDYCCVLTFQFLLDSLAFCRSISSIVRREDVMLGFLLIPKRNWRTPSEQYSEILCKSISVSEITLKYYTQKKS